jgi:anti-anti-sigma regulatory factor
VELLEKSIKAHLARGVRRIRLDLRGVPYADGRGLGALVTCRDCAHHAGAVLTVAGARGKLREQIRLTGLDRAGLRSKGRLPADSRGARGAKGISATLGGKFPGLAPRTA